MNSVPLKTVSGSSFSKNLQKVPAFRRICKEDVFGYRLGVSGSRQRCIDFAPVYSVLRASDPVLRMPPLFFLIKIGAACAGSRSARAKPLNSTSCLKIAEDVAHRLAYIHQVSTLIHGNLKSSNVLLGTGFEACITDYCLSFVDSSFTEDPDFAAYKAPEARNSSRRATSKFDVYAFGVLLLELLTGEHPSQQPFLAPADLQDWVRTMRDDDGSEDNRLEMLTEVASI